MTHLPFKIRFALFLSILGFSGAFFLATSGQTPLSPETLRASRAQYLVQNPSSARAHFDVALDEYQQERYYQAYTLLRHALDLDHDASGGEEKHWILMGDALYQLGLLEEALEAYQKALRINPFHQQAHDHYWITWNRLQRHLPPDESKSDQDRQNGEDQEETDQDDQGKDDQDKDDQDKDDQDKDDQDKDEQDKDDQDKDDQDKDDQDKDDQDKDDQDKDDQDKDDQDKDDQDKDDQDKDDQDKDDQDKDDQDKDDRDKDDQQSEEQQQEPNMQQVRPDLEGFFRQQNPDDVRNLLNLHQIGEGDQHDQKP